MSDSRAGAAGRAGAGSGGGQLSSRYAAVVENWLKSHGHQDVHASLSTDGAYVVCSLSRYNIFGETEDEPFLTLTFQDCGDSAAVEDEVDNALSSSLQ